MVSWPGPACGACGVGADREHALASTTSAPSSAAAVPSRRIGDLRRGTSWVPHRYSAPSSRHTNLDLSRTSVNRCNTINDPPHFRPARPVRSL